MSPNEDDAKMTKRGHAVLFPGQSPDLTELQKSGPLQGIKLPLEEVSGKTPRDKKKPQFPMSVQSLSKQAFLETEPLRKKLTSTKGTPEAPIVIIGDMLLPWCKNFADKLQIPCYSFYHCTLYYSLNVLEFPKILKAAFKSQTAADNDELLPAQVASALTDADILSLLRSREYSPAFFECTEHMLSIVENTLKSAGILLNTAETLESSHGVLTAMKELMGPSQVICIGPSVQIPGFGLAYSSASTDTILPQLDSQQRKSVLYVELAAALESSRVPFLFVLRIGSEELSEVLPPGFEQRTSGADRNRLGQSRRNSAASSN